MNNNDDLEKNEKSEENLSDLTGVSEENRKADLSGSREEHDLDDKPTYEEIRKVGADTNQKFFRTERDPVFQEQKKGSGVKVTLILIVLLLVVFGVIGVIFRHQVNSFFKGSEPKPTETPIPTPEPTVTPEPFIKGDWSFEILNGSGVSGQAKKLADKIKELGYTVIKTGNADKQTYEKTELLVKSGLEEKIDAVIADIKDVVKVASVSGEVKDSTASAQIIIGKDLDL